MHRSGRTRWILPMVGTATVAAGATGAVAAPFALSALAAPATVDASGQGSAAAQGALESCDAYFGFRKELVSFEVVDQNGDDGVAHAVPADTQVVLVLTNGDGDTLECTPVEITQADWEDELGTGDDVPAYPGPGHYAYPSLADDNSVDGFDDIVSVGFRVAGLPDAVHTLVSPTGTKELLQSQLEPESMVFDGVIDPRVLDFIEAEADADAADAWAGIPATCNQDQLDDADPDLIAAFGVLNDLVNDDESVSCGGFQDLNQPASQFLGLEESIANVETITLALPVPETTTPPAAQPVAVQPSFTG